MNIDIGTVVIVLVILSGLQVVGFLLQYATNRTCPGMEWWLLWSAATAMGFIVMLQRKFLPAGLIPPSIVLTNVLILSGHIFLYIGIMRFLDRKENRTAIALLFVLFVPSTLCAVYGGCSNSARALLLYLSGAAVSLLAAQALLAYKTPSIRASTTFLSVVFLAHGGYFVLRTAAALTILPVDEAFNPTRPQTATFLVHLGTTYLCTFGLIVMANQRSRAEISEAKEKFELIFNAGPDGALITRLSDGCFVEINDGFTKMTGFSRAEVIGKSILDFDIWKDPAARRKTVAELAEKRFFDNLECAFRRKDGTWFGGMVSARLITLQGLPHIVSVIRDVTDRRRAEAALRASEEKFRLLVENSHDIIYSLTADGVFLFVSPAWKTILGHPAAEVVGNSFQSFVHPEDLPGCMHFLEEVIGTGQRREGVEYRVRDSNGIWHWHTSSAVPFHDETGAITGFYGIAKDIGEFKKKEEEMQELISRLQKALDEIRTLKGIVPICSNCKKIRDDEGYWQQVESYVAQHTEAQFSHGICPDCMKKLYPEFSNDEKTVPE